MSLGEGIDPVTREIGGPVLDEHVHVGPGAAILGPITVGASTKVGAGSVLRHSVPPYTRVEAPEPICTSRNPHAPANRGEFPCPKSSSTNGRSDEAES